MIEDGLLGTLHRAVWVCNNWYRTPAYHKSAPWRSSWNGECGGLLINQNQHYLDMWQWFFGMPSKLYADMEFGHYNDFLVDDAVDIQFYYDDGFHGTMISSTGEAPGVNRLEIWGSMGRLTIEDGTKLYLDQNEISTEEFSKTNKEIYVGLPHQLQEISLSETTNPYAEVFANFAQHLLDGTPLYADGLEGLKTVELTNAAYVSGWEESKVSLPVSDDHYLHLLTARQRLEEK
jgi:predicted dehydrogenase